MSITGYAIRFAPLRLAGMVAEQAFNVAGFLLNSGKPLDDDLRRIAADVREIRKLLDDGRGSGKDVGERAEESSGADRYSSPASPSPAVDMRVANDLFQQICEVGDAVQDNNFERALKILAEMSPETADQLAEWSKSIEATFGIPSLMDLLTSAAPVASFPARTEDAAETPPAGHGTRRGHLSVEDVPDEYWDTMPGVLDVERVQGWSPK